MSSPQPEYVDKLLSVEDAADLLKMSVTSLWRFRKRHKIALLSGRKLHLDDIIQAFERERGHFLSSKSKSRQ